MCCFVQIVEEVSDDIGVSQAYMCCQFAVIMMILLNIIYEDTVFGTCISIGSQHPGSHICSGHNLRLWPKLFLKLY